MRRLGRWLLALPAGAILLLVVGVLGFAAVSRSRLPDRSTWHRLHLDEEFRAGRKDAPASFADYMKLEDRLFAELHRKILDDPKASDSYVLSRYRPGSVPEQ